MVLDLVSPWYAAAEATDAPAARRAFRQRHHHLLEALRTQRAPLADALPLAAGRHGAPSLLSRASDPALHQHLRELLASAAHLGADGCRALALLPGDGSGDACEVLPWPDAIVAIFLDRVDDEPALAVAVARGAAMVTRWSATDSASAVCRPTQAVWNRWQLQRDVDLAEWICAEGLAVHLAERLVPGLEPHRALGIPRSALAALRQREKKLQALLDADLDQRGAGLILRWLTPDAPTAQRTVRGTVVPSMAGRYLGWRMLSRRIARVGLRDAIRMEA